MSAPEEAARSVLAFWFDEVGKNRWFARDSALDEEIARRFGALRVEVVRSRAKGWRSSLPSITAAIILIDQFSRNLHRGSRKAFDSDPLALELAFEALDRGWSHSAPEDWRAFLLMPLMHSEELDIQERSVSEFARLGNPLNLDFAIQHRDQIAKFGRFPGRNQALGRISTPEEQAALEAGAAF